MTTIRKNSVKKIADILSRAVLITIYAYDGRDVTSEATTTEQVMRFADSFRSVSVSTDGVLHVSIHGNHFYNAYPSKDVARKNLTPQAFAKFFGTEAEAAGEPAELINAEITGNRIARVAADWSAIAGEPVQVEVFQNTFLARLSELGALRLEHKYSSPKARAVKDRNGNAWTFRLETSLGVKEDVQAAASVN